MAKENNPEAVEAAIETPQAAFIEAAEEVSTPVPDSKYTADDIAKARAQEKDKLYPVVDKLKEELALLKKEREEQAAKEAERLAKRQQREAEREAEKKAKLEDEMSVKELLKAKESEWQKRLDEERTERERLFATLQLEREYQELQQYRQQRLEQERENIVPELIDLVAGNTKDEIEASINDLKARTSKLLESVAAVSQQTRKEMVGSRVTMPASGPLDNDSEQRYSPNDISNMSMADYAKNRQRLLGGSVNNRGQGLFG